MSEKDSDGDIPPRGSYSNSTDEESSHTERPIGILSQEEDTYNDEVPSKDYYSDFR